MNNTVTKEQQRQEAIERLRILESKGLMPEVRRDFEKGRVMWSERVVIPGLGANGILYHLDENPEFEKIIRDFEAETDSLVYHATHETFEFGRVLDLYHIGKHADEWKMDRDDLEDGYCLAYAANLDVDWCSEFGTVGIAVSPSGGLVRNA